MTIFHGIRVMDYQALAHLTETPNLKDSLRSSGQIDVDQWNLHSSINILFLPNGIY